MILPAAQPRASYAVLGKGVCELFRRETCEHGRYLAVLVVDGSFEATFTRKFLKTREKEAIQ